MLLGFAVPASGSWATPANAVHVGRRAEDLGYSSLWTFQRLLSPVDDQNRPVLDPQYRSVHDPLITLAYLAGHTAAARLGVAVVNLPFYSPIVLAKLLTTLDHVSNGRLDVGLGIGWLPEELEAVGMSPKRRGRRADEYLRCMRTIWSERIVEHTGEFYRLARSLVDPKPLQRPHPPLLLGGTAEAALRRAGRLADGWISSSRADLRHIGQSIAVVRQAAVDAGRDPDTLRFICRGVVRRGASGGGHPRAPLTGSFDDIRADLAELAGQGVTETFVDLNFDPHIGSPDADPAAAMARGEEVLEALAPG
jgi:probable F420-dependent oxidoreductase